MDHGAGRAHSPEFTRVVSGLALIDRTLYLSSLPEYVHISVDRVNPESIEPEHAPGRYIVLLDVMLNYPLFRCPSTYSRS